MIMSYFSGILHTQQNTVPTTSAEGAGLGMRTDMAQRTGIKGDRLVNQLFACMFSIPRRLMVVEWMLTVFPVDTVTNQAINAFTEMGLPYIKQYYEEWRGTQGNSEAEKRQHVKAVEKVTEEASTDERRLMEKVARELHLPEYSAFGESRSMG
jgi:anoctamin-10